MTETQNDKALPTRVDADLVVALKARDQTTLDTLRLLKTAAKNAEVARRRPLTDDEYVDVIRQQVKMRRDAASEYDRAGRTEQAAQERAESAVLQGYLPPQMDASQIRETVRTVIDETGSSGPGDLGKVMAGAMRRLKGKADGADIQAAARELLSGGTG
jgi:uncharacterized protein YqeY